MTNTIRWSRRIRVHTHLKWKPEVVFRCNILQNSDFHNPFKVVCIKPWYIALSPRTELEHIYSEGFLSVPWSWICCQVSIQSLWGLMVKIFAGPILFFLRATSLWHPVAATSCSAWVLRGFTTALCLNCASAHSQHCGVPPISFSLVLKDQDCGSSHSNIPDVLSPTTALLLCSFANVYFLHKI